jgi:hypothetical protein
MVRAVCDAAARARGEKKGGGVRLRDAARGREGEAVRHHCVGPTGQLQRFNNPGWWGWGWSPGPSHHTGWVQNNARPTGDASVSSVMG